MNLSRARPKFAGGTNRRRNHGQPEQVQSGGGSRQSQHAERLVGDKNDNDETQREAKK